MLPFVSALLGAKNRATFVGYTKGTGSAGTPVTITRPTGTAIGDVVVIFGAAPSFSGITTGGTNTGSWTATSNVANTGAVYKRLVDLGSITVDMGSGSAFSYIVLTFRDVAAVAVKAANVTVASASTTATGTGFVKSAAIVGLVTLAGSTSAGDGTLSITSPSGFTKIDEQSNANSHVAAGYHTDAELYVNSTNVVWDGFQTLASGGGPRSVFLLEFT